MRGMEAWGGEAEEAGCWKTCREESHPAAVAAGGKIKMAKSKRRTTSKLPGTRLED